MRFIPSKIHAIADYSTGLLLILLPLALRQPMATLVALGSGICIMILAMLTDDDGGMLEAIPLKAHLCIDLVLGLALLALAWVFKFSPTSRVAFSGVGLLSVFFSLCTQTETPQP